MKDHPVKMTKEQALAFKEQWRQVAEIQLEELRSSSCEKKLKQLNVLMKWTRDFKWENKLKSDVEDVRERWIKLKSNYHEKTR